MVNDNDKDLRELLELISSTRSMLENAKKNGRASHTLLKLFNNLSSSLNLYQHTIINLNDEIEQQNKQDSIALSEIEIDELKISIENTKNMLVDSHNSEGNAILNQKLYYQNICLQSLQNRREFKKNNSENIKSCLNISQKISQSHVKIYLEEIKSGESILPFVFEISSNMMGLISTSVAILKFTYDFLKVECSIWNNKFEDLEKNGGSIIGEIEGLVSFLVIYSYNIITIYSNADSAIRKAEWIQLRREALPVVKMYIENYIPQKYDNNMENLIDGMKKFIQEI